MKIAVLLSGGVDSSVALRLLQAEGHELHAFYLKVWLEDELAHLGHCPWEEDLRYARAVCEQAGVPLEIVPLQRQYHQRVVEHAVAELRAGRTPSPDIYCNRRIKFGAFFDHLAGRDFDKIASGHYARITDGGQEVADGGLELRKGMDPVKDQTYFLFRLDQEQLARCWFPIGGYPKSEVRRLALELGLANRDRKDSQGICFLGKIAYGDFIRAYLGEKPGEIRDVGSGRRLGEHRGYWFHTIGQRRGLGLGGGPWYVVDKDLEANVVWVAHGHVLPDHGGDRFRLGDVHWILRPPAENRLQVKLRHSPQTFPCELTEPASAEPEVRLDATQPGIASGQSAVFYDDDGDRCLGGGTILSVRPHRQNSRRYSIQ
ncbi:MAG: tRNA 2-thiouridine(34) synthase MnmA [Thermoanaerobaculia bacterium]